MVSFEVGGASLSRAVYLLIHMPSDGWNTSEVTAKCILLVYNWQYSA